MPQYKIYTVDAFAAKPFQGNPAAVVLVPSKSPVSDSTMQSLGAEMNISETAFLVPHQKLDEADEFKECNRFGLRWFTPTSEVKLCGHATLASAFTLFNKADNIHDTLYFDTLSGELVVTRTDDDYLQMKLSTDLPQPMPATDDVKTIVEGFLDRPYESSIETMMSPYLRFMLIYDPKLTPQQLADMSSSATAEMVAAGQRNNVNAVIIASSSPQDQWDFQSRVFAPWLGVVEDPVCGSAHAVLAPFWQAKLQKSPQSFVACQLSKRNGDLKVSLANDNSHVLIFGKATVVVEGLVNL